MSFDSPLPPYNASDPSASFLNASCLDLLLIELVPMAFRLANELDAGERQRDGVAGLSEKDLSKGGAAGANGGHGAGGSVAGSLSVAATRTTGGRGGEQGTGNGTVMDEDEERDAVFFRLESLGYRVGQGLVERYVSRNATPRGRRLRNLTDNDFVLGFLVTAHDLQIRWMS
jgi:hypothetical protein